MEQKQKAYLGIDVGAKGYLALQCKGEWDHYSIADNDLYQLSNIMAEIKRKHNDDLVCVIEEIHAVFGSSASATFSFGEIFGKLQALLVANNISYVMVQPKEWQKEMWTNSDMVVEYKKVKRKDKEISQKKVDTKKTSINAAKRLFSTMDFRRSDRCKNIDDNKVDATLMSEYARRKNL